MSRKITALLIAAVMAVPLLSLAQEATGEDARRLELEKKYPDIKFNWPRKPTISEQNPAAAALLPAGAQQQQSAVVLPAAPEAEIVPSDVAQIAEEEVLLRQRATRWARET